MNELLESLEDLYALFTDITDSHIAEAMLLANARPLERGKLRFALEALQRCAASVDPKITHVMQEGAALCLETTASLETTGGSTYCPRGVED